MTENPDGHPSPRIIDISRPLDQMAEKFGTAVAEALLKSVREHVPPGMIQEALDLGFDGAFNALEDELMRQGASCGVARLIADRAGEHGALWLEYLYPPKPGEMA